MGKPAERGATAIPQGHATALQEAEIMALGGRDIGRCHDFVKDVAHGLTDALPGSKWLGYPGAVFPMALHAARRRKYRAVKGAGSFDDSSEVKILSMSSFAAFEKFTTAAAGKEGG